MLAGLLALPATVVGASIAAERVGGSSLRSGENGARFTVAARAGVVGLTFDDGPDLAYTPDVLDILAAHQATATFFVIGNRVDRYPELCRRALAAGHELANHTASHPHLELGSHRRVVEEVEGGVNALRRLGVEPRYFRPPFGRATEDVRDVVDRAGLDMIMWDGCLEKFVDHAPVADGVRQLLTGVRPGDILLAHDGGPPDRRRTIQALPMLLDGLTRRGLRTVDVSTLLGQTRRPARGGPDALDVRRPAGAVLGVLPA